MARARRARRVRHAGGAASQAATRNANISAKLWTETLGNEQTAFKNSLSNPAKRNVLPDPMRKAQYRRLRSETRKQCY